ncbi:type IV toxin-antitoxin system AbiEi family antitoxin domain-containing protein [Ruania alkalisoli]|uniref:Type IV toxin-antitoxin system AbiEi family antitoxin domain-containing protein n=1 Tax=Ruania alkalisoli TaxID=2779775 RepID=A0A7M1SRU4_9MICO|nr:type IV toxin-antitoxin system AbiEi family antitoxin domain-containing protein [Ruania alkalisoli]QOR70300.1 type IV toxin-antitoxin system AbiEi family antitoxin domain-containing protein [Ruania alkalisoli]
MADPAVTPDPALTLIASMLAQQEGVISRCQAHACGLTDNDLRRLRRRRLLTSVHTGIYVDHTGPRTWDQRAWAAVLAYWPAALAGESARRAVAGTRRTGRGDDDAIHLVVDRHRHLYPDEGIVIRRSAHLRNSCLWNTSPPRQRIEYVALELAATAQSDVDAVAHLADALGARITTPERLAAALAHRERFARRAFLTGIIDDLCAGTCSTLEHGYFTRVERAHRLPPAKRQFRESLKGSLYRDVYYEDQALLVELDGRLDHSSTRDRDRDHERDLDAAATDRLTLRLGWGQVFDRSCATAMRIAAGLQARGWNGSPRRCPACPASLAVPLRG